MKHFVYQSVERCLLLVVLFCKFKLQNGWTQTGWYFRAIYLVSALKGKATQKSACVHLLNPAEIFSSCVNANAVMGKTKSARSTGSASSFVRKELLLVGRIM
jgi:hypothetical protein